jgi:hypothetical protein
MEYITELHCHSGEVSNCASATAQEIVRAYCAAGYTSLVLTNHFSFYTFGFGNLQKFPGNPESHSDKVDFFMSGYHALCEAAGDRLNVILGVELRSNTDDSDYLIYGVDEYFLRSHPDLMDMPIAGVLSEVHAAGGLLVQAHPFRNHMKIQKPERLDGVEVFNGCVRHDSRNDIALLWAERYGLLMTSGSDYHHAAKDSPNGGIVTDFPITDGHQLAEVLKSKNYRLLCAGEYPIQATRKD